ncbi:hypothetical protein DXG01_000683 [Tephrocybe rancida]|nr:hypothetical protein DXG01_000683 [Tephrocybe rancida]
MFGSWDAVKEFTRTMDIELRDPLPTQTTPRATPEPATHVPTPNPVPAPASRGGGRCRCRCRCRAIPGSLYIDGPKPPPGTLEPPGPRTIIQGFYVVSVGQKVGIVFNWNIANSLITGIRGSSAVSYPTWKEALNVYTTLYDQHLLQAHILIGGPFDPEASQLTLNEDLNQYTEGLI